MKRNLSRVTVLDVLLISALLGLPGWALVRSWRAAGERPVASIFQNNRLLGVYPLDSDRVIAIDGQDRPAMKVEIRNGAIRVTESNCPKGVCKHTGWIRTPGRSIICVPNRVLIQLRGDSSEYDAESY